MESLRDRLGVGRGSLSETTMDQELKGPEPRCAPIATTQA